jgi:hypothetical protein
VIKDVVRGGGAYRAWFDALQHYTMQPFGHRLCVTEREVVLQVLDASKQFIAGTMMRLMHPMYNSLMPQVIANHLRGCSGTAKRMKCSW